MSTPDLTPTHREALTKALTADGPLSPDEYDVLLALRDACPEEPRLEDGIYEVSDRCGSLLRYVRDGRYSRSRSPDGPLHGGGYPLPTDVSGWRRIDGPPTVTPEQVEEAAQAASRYSEARWATLSEETRVDYRDHARKILAAAGIEVGH